MARAQIAKKEVHEDMSGVTIAFADGKPLTVNLADLPDEMVGHLALHGLSQKLGDSYSGEQDIASARALAAAVAERLREGNWKAVREGGGGGRISDLAQALSNVTGQPLEECVTKLADMEKDQKSGLRKHPKIKAELAKIAAERAATAAAKAEDAPVDDSILDNF